MAREDASYTALECDTVHTISYMICLPWSIHECTVSYCVPVVYGVVLRTSCRRGILRDKIGQALTSCSEARAA